MTINAWRMLAGYPIIGAGIVAVYAWGDGAHGNLSMLIGCGSLMVWILAASLIQKR